jgi:Na+/proline symporter
MELLLFIFISLLVPCLAVLIFCALQKPRWPYFLAALLGAVAFSHLGLILGSMVWSRFSDMPLLEVGGAAFIGGILGACAGPAVVACFLGPADRRAGARTGMVIGFPAGALLALLATAFVRSWGVGYFEDPWVWALGVLGGSVFGAAAGGLIGSYVGEAWKRDAAAGQR